MLEEKIFTFVVWVEIGMHDCLKTMILLLWPNSYIRYAKDLYGDNLRVEWVIVSYP